PQDTPSQRCSQGQAQKREITGAWVKAGRPTRWQPRVRSVRTHSTSRTGLMTLSEIPSSQGLYDPWFEHDACGVGFVVDLKGRKSHDIVHKAKRILVNLEHRGACGCEKNTGDGAGILLQTPHRFLAQECDRLGFALPEPGAYGVGFVFLPTEPGE